MKIVITGSLGNISKPLTKILVEKGHSITVISSNPDRQTEIERMGAKAEIGSMYDPDFLARTFKGADIAYVMEAIGFHSFFDHKLNVLATIEQIVNSYKQAIEQSGVKHVVHLSSIGGHTNTGNGILAFHHRAEQILSTLPADVSIKFMRPVGFYNNMFAFINTIKSQNTIIANYGGDDKEPWVSPQDIATTIAEEMELPFEGRTVRYIASEEISPNEIAQTLGSAVGKNDTQWITVSDEDFLGGLLKAGMNPDTAKGYTEMNAARRCGVLYEDYNKNKPSLGKIKLSDFAKDFAAAYEYSQNLNH